MIMLVHVKPFKLFAILQLFCLAFFLTTSLWPSHALAKAKTDPEKDKGAFSAQRAIFLKAEASLNQGQWESYTKLKNQLTNYPLYPYLLYGEYDKKMNQVTFPQILSFLEAYNDSPLSDQLRTNWLHAQANKGAWGEFLKGYKQTKDLPLQCHYLQAQIQTKGLSPQVLAQIQPVWAEAFSTPKACENVFRTFEKSNLMTRPLLWQKIKRAIQEGQVSTARFLAKYLKKTELALVELWIMIHQNPYIITNPKYFPNNHSAYLEMIVHGASAIAKSDPKTGIEVWQLINKKYSFTERHWGLVVRAIGLAFAKQRHPEALKWLNQVPNIYTNQAVHESRVRASLIKEDWTTVLHWLKNLPPDLSQAEEWKYWQARALEKVGRTHESLPLLTQLSSSRSYYGFLASKHLLKPYFVRHEKIESNEAQIQFVSRKKGVLRARELYHLGRFEKARREWRRVTKHLSDIDRHAAASLALKWNLPNWSILAFSGAQNKEAVDLRFPLVHAPKIFGAAQSNKIDPAWIFAVTRQESAFVADACSNKGALGLMQLIPSTAHMVAKQKQIPLKGKANILEPQTNIQLGTGYLKFLLDKHSKNPVLATAAYNAGPGRIKKWLPVRDMDADMWIETHIPFKETREYVKNVMTYLIIYQQLLGKKPSLSNHMPNIPATLNQEGSRT